MRRPLQSLRHPPPDSALGRAARHELVAPIIAALLRASIVRESGRFIVRELSRRQSTRVYTLRGAGTCVAICHASADVHALDQAFYQRAHEPPPNALAALASLNRPPRALDLGAHIGMWGLWLHTRFPGAEVLALEPDPRNAAQHRAQIALNGLDDRWKVIEAAAATRDDSVYFTAGMATNGRIAAGPAGGAVEVPALDVFALLDAIDLLKIDIEGGEWRILADARAREIRVPVVMLEYHAHDAPGGGPQKAASDALSNAGYDVELGAETSPGFGVVWGCRIDSG